MAGVATLTGYTCTYISGPELEGVTMALFVMYDAPSR